MSDLTELYKVDSTVKSESSDDRHESSDGNARFHPIPNSGVRANHRISTVRERIHDETGGNSDYDSGESGSLMIDEAVHVEERDTQYDSRYCSIASDRTSLRTFFTTRSKRTTNSRDSQYDSRYFSVASDRTSLRTFLTAESRQSMIIPDSARSVVSERTPWQQTLYDKNLMLSEFDETNWSGRGQHVEFGPDEASMIDEILTPKGVLGHSSTALVERVRCKRIMLARKKIRCNWRMKREDAIQEVAHLQRLGHAHIVQCVGTYVFGKDLAILLYPATAYNLETFLDQCADLQEKNPLLPADGLLLYHMQKGLSMFFKCLPSSLCFVHQRLVKHMDIKPTNLLIQERSLPHETEFHIYLADFGIARSYSTAADAETDSRTPFTKTYAAPEVVRQDRRGMSADVFSLGCVFLEMVAVLCKQRDAIIKIRKQNPKGDSSYQANLDAISQCDLLKSLVKQDYRTLDYSRPYMNDTHYLDAVVVMMEKEPQLRPTALALKAAFGDGWCCSRGPEPFESVVPPAPV